MSKFFRLAVAALAAVAGSLVFVTGTAQAALVLNISFDLDPSPLTVGQTGIPATIVLENNSTGVDDGQMITVCNSGDDANAALECAPAGSANTPQNDIGINLLTSCGLYATSTTCAPGGADPDVFEPSLTGTGQAGSQCDGVAFDIVQVGDAHGTWRFVPQGGANLILDDNVGPCIVEFTMSVANYPLLDLSPAPAFPGQQTALMMSATGFSIDPINGVEPATPAVSSTRTIVRNEPSIATQASPTIALGAGTLTDTAFVSGRAFADETGTVDFRLYGPFSAGATPLCTGTPVFESLAVPISSTQTSISSEPFTPSAIGTYYWVAAYSGDRNNEQAAGACGDDNETVVVVPGQPTLSTQASDPVRLGAGDLTDTATVSGRVGPLASTVSFSLFGPDDADCTGPAIFTDTDVALPTDSDSVTSAGYTPMAPGTYRWIATYSGDTNNLPAAGECNDAGESTVVDQALPVLATDAGSDVSIGDPLRDTATVTGRVAPGDATLDFRLFGPDDADCSGDAVFEQLGVPFAGDAEDSLTSDPYTPTEVGTYRWVVTYSGDTNNEGSVGECGDPAETVDVLLGTPTIVTEASASVPVGVGQLSDAAIVNGRVDPQPGATVSFRLYGPGDTTCSSAPVFEDLDNAYPVAGGTLRSASFTPTVAGTYRWVASYSGDSNNLPAVGECGDPAETVVVTPAVAPELPATGSETSILMRSGGVLFLAGLALFGLGNRRRYAR